MKKAPREGLDLIRPSLRHLCVEVTIELQSRASSFMKNISSTNFDQAVHSSTTAEACFRHVSSLLKDSSDHQRREIFCLLCNKKTFKHVFKAAFFFQTEIAAGLLFQLVQHQLESLKNELCLDFLLMNSLYDLKEIKKPETLKNKQTCNSHCKLKVNVIHGY